MVADYRCEIEFLLFGASYVKFYMFLRLLPTRLVF
jgi:hypothetical protein